MKRNYVQKHGDELRLISVHNLLVIYCSRDQERVKEQRALLDKRREQIRQKWRADNQQAIQQQVLELRRSSHELLLAEQEA